VDIGLSRNGVVVMDMLLFLAVVLIFVFFALGA
jgi:hypothetical protein